MMDKRVMEIKLAQVNASVLDYARSTLANIYPDAVLTNMTSNLDPDHTIGVCAFLGDGSLVNIDIEVKALVDNSS
jgi:hypothetical protein